MKTTILTIAMSISLVISLAQGNKFQQKMGKTLSEMGKAKSIQDYQKVANTFQLISEKETKEWLPKYYEANNYIIMSFKEKDATKKDDYLDIAEKALNKSIELNPKEAENYALQSLFNTARLVVNPMVRGQKYSILSAKSTQIALKLDSNNVRAKYLAISGKFGKAKFFGGNTESYCVEAQELLKIWDNFKPKSKIHPNWGKNDLTSMANSCSKKEVPTKQEIKKKEGITLTITFSNLKNTEGQILLSLVNENKIKVKSIVKDIDSKEIKIELTGLQKGKYAIQYYHDENSNGILDKDNYGRPTENYGFSNNVKGMFGPPKFKKQLFELKEDKSVILK